MRSLCTVLARSLATAVTAFFKQHKPWFDEECLGILDQRKQGKIQWTQDPSQSNVDNLNNVKRDANRHLRTKRRHN
jgi:hypothetical protein